jgi:two-component system OmpR family response regulator
MRVLVIEDEERLARALKQGLEREGYAVDCLADGADAEYRLRVSHEEYDLVILDLGLPGMDGIDVCRRLRAVSIGLPVLMLTARDGTEAKVTGMDSGADDYLVKPFDFDELLARLRMLLRRPRQMLPPPLAVGDLVLDPARRRATSGGRDIVLTTKEFTLLELFVRHAGQVLSRDQILSHVWDAEFDSFSNVVDVHVRNLRRKIDRDRGDSLLETVRGLGYRLRA